MDNKQSKHKKKAKTKEETKIDSNTESTRRIEHHRQMASISTLDPIYLAEMINDCKDDGVDWDTTTLIGMNIENKHEICGLFEEYVQFLAQSHIFNNSIPKAFVSSISNKTISKTPHHGLNQSLYHIPREWGLSVNPEDPCFSFTTDYEDVLECIQFQSIQESILSHCEEEKFITDIKKKMKEILFKYDKKDTSLKDILMHESQDEECCSVSYDNMDKIQQIRVFCGPFRRIEIILDAYHKLVHDESLWNKYTISDIIQVCDQYKLQQLFNDFIHIKVMHIDDDNDKIRSRDHNERKHEYFHDIAAKICKYFELKFPCDLEKCHCFSRHYRIRTNDDKEQQLFVKQSSKFETETDYTENVVFQQQCDAIHSYFLHSTIKFGVESSQINGTEKEAMIDKYNRYAKGRLYSKRYSNVFMEDKEVANDDDSKQNAPKVKKSAYVGHKDDDAWWKDVNPNDNKQSENEIYRILVENMGVFRWQNPHGFLTGQSQQTHYQPKWKNIKQEALENEYEPISKDNWNQTLRKATVFLHSWAGQKIKTKYKDFFDDQVTGHKQKWKKDERITMQEVVTLKLYTDFDKLQFALKKCFRFETLDDILKQHEYKADESESEKAKQDLEKRLRNFYHWRGGLLIVLNKFGTKLNQETNMVLYHGVNAKMLIKPTQTLAFSGPLSTSSSYYVARTFSTAKGMVLKVTSQFPRLNYCNAFDASLISDYPEEQEWLVGFMYVRILEVRTRKLCDKSESFKDLMSKVPLSSWVRQEFFAIHLFNQQIFSMSQHLERIIAQFLKINRKECCNPEKYQHQYDHFKDWNMDDMYKYICSRYHGNTKTEILTDKEDKRRKIKIVPILWNKFTEFRKKPNLKQRIKFDTISDHLKRFFMEEIEEKEIKTNKKKWIISFDEITTVYPYIKEIHFINQYKFDDHVLSNLIKQIERKKNTIEKIVFLYYNYKNTNDKNQPSNHTIFQDPDGLNKQWRNKLENQLKWKIKPKQNGKTGYKIRIYQR